MNENKLHIFAPFGVGLDQLFDRLETGLKEGTSYPPHNIIKESDDVYRIELALAGFKKDEVSITEHDGELIVKASLAVDESKETETYLHRGIGKRKFTRRFKLGEHVRVSTAAYENGILTVKLIREVPDEMKPRNIAIE